MTNIRKSLSRFLVAFAISLAIISCGSGGGGGGGGNTDPRLHNTWTWMSGSDTRNQGGVYGTLNTPDPANVPGARYEAVTWIDASGDLWLFGGHGYDINAPTGFGKLNDLWRYDGSDWTWISGSDTYGASGVYGTAGVADASNVPGARSGSISWVDASGNLWLFGGYGVDESGTTGYLNDLWKFDGAEWTWVSGSKAVDQNGTYDGLGADEPGGRYGAVSWKDSSGNIWMFGGNGFDGGAVNAGALNDLWKYDGSSWIWEAGSDARNQNGTYDGLGADEPGGREGAVGWIDASNNLWLFSGKGYADTGGIGNLNDLWKYDGASWTWVGGSNATYQAPTYGTLESADVGNIPGSRTDAVAWKDSSGNFWLFGGYGSATDGVGELNDLWRFDGTNWAWMHGSNLRRQAGSFDVLGQENTTNTPGAKKFAAAWTDSGGDFWLFGGDGRDSAGAAGLTNDLWEFHP